MFSIVTFKERWDILIDKVNAPYFTDEEFSSFVNMGMDTYIASHLTGAKRSAEETDKIEEDFQPLIKQVQLLSNSVGEVLNSDVEALLGSKVFYRYAVAIKKECGDISYCRYVRHNDYFKIKKNSWKKPTEEYPVYRIFEDKIVVYPTDERKVLISLIKEPSQVVYDSVDSNNNVDLPFGVNAAMKILQISLQLAGISMDDTEFYQYTNAEEQKLG